MKPTQARTMGEHCQMMCPYMKMWEHPFWHHTAWCEYLLKDLFYYDGSFLCHCKTEEPNPKLLGIRGRTS
jgi:hypothetical protein